MIQIEVMIKFSFVLHSSIWESCMNLFKILFDFSLTELTFCLRNFICLIILSDCQQLFVVSYHLDALTFQSKLSFYLCSEISELSSFYVNFRIITLKTNWTEMEFKFFFCGMDECGWLAGWMCLFQSWILSLNWKWKIFWIVCLCWNISLIVSWVKTQVPMIN